jgi:hypothetical protein
MLTEPAGASQETDDVAVSQVWAQVQAAARAVPKAPRKEFIRLATSRAWA